MPNIHLTPIRFLAACALGVALFAALPAASLAAVYNGGGLFDGMQQAAGVGVATGTLPDFIKGVIDRAVSYATLAGVVVVVAAGFMLILGFGSDEMKERAKKAIIYTCVGLLVLYFAQLIVDFFATAGEADVRNPIIATMNTAVSYLALLAVITVVVAGFYLVLSFGNDDNKEKAKKIIYFTLAGLLVVFFARVIVVFVLTLPAAG